MKANSKWWHNNSEKEGLMFLEYDTGKCPCYPIHFSSCFALSLKPCLLVQKHAGKFIRTRSFSHWYTNLHGFKV